MTVNLKHSWTRVRAIKAWGGSTTFLVRSIGPSSSINDPSIPDPPGRSVRLHGELSSCSRDFSRYLRTFLICLSLLDILHSTNPTSTLLYVGLAQYGSDFGSCILSVCFMATQNTKMTATKPSFASVSNLASLLFTYDVPVAHQAITDCSNGSSYIQEPARLGSRESETFAVCCSPSVCFT